MEDSAPTTDPQTVSAKPRNWSKTLVVASVCVIVFAAIEYLASTVIASHPLSVGVPISVIVLLGLNAILMALGAAIYVHRHWREPVRRLRGALEEIRDGTLPIDQLPDDLGGLSPVHASLAQVLRQYRQQKAEVAKLNLEMRQRVAQRTEGLERLVGSLRAQSTRDELTGLYNRRMLDLSLDKLIQRCHEDVTPLCLLMVDVDYFKMLNDTLGHPAGDAFLRATGQLIRCSVREQDMAFRCGGDEFVIVAPGAAYDHGQSLAQRLIDLVDALGKSLNVPRKPRLSIGLATTTELTPGQGARELLQSADQDLYAVKSARKSHRAA